MPVPYFVIDAFAGEPFAGNPAAVVHLSSGLDDAAMQRIASEFNLSETTFVLPAGALAGDAAMSGDDTRPRFCFRWFTPAAEVSMCGHATVAGIRALWDWGLLGPPGLQGDVGGVELAIETRSGVLSAWAEPLPNAIGAETVEPTSKLRLDHHAPNETPLMIWLALPAPKLTEVAEPADELFSALGIEGSARESDWPVYRTQDEDLIIWVESAASLFSVQPDFRTLAKWCQARGVRGVCAATTGTLDSGIDVQSRFFAPLFGIDEDPVTGSIHGPLCWALAQKSRGKRSGNTVALSCVQGKPGGRFGQLYALVNVPTGDEGPSVRIGGSTQVVMKGELLAGA